MHKPSKTNAIDPRTLDYLFIWTNDLKQSRCKLLHLHANKITI